MKRRKREHRDYEGAMRHQMAALKAASEELQRRAMAGMSTEALLKLDSDFETWAHENQLPPNGEGWRVWLMLAGRGFGKTRAGAEWGEAQLFSGDHADGLRGPEHDFAWCDELAKWREARKPGSMCSSD
jgi:phage terminase large subunit-like protein